MEQPSQQEIAKLQQQVETQAYQLQEQARRLEALENELAEAQTRLARTTQVDERLAQLKDEIFRLIERRLNRPQPELAETGHSLAAQLDAHTQTLHELRREIDKTLRYDEQLSLARTEMTRLNKTVSTFQVQLDTLKKQLDEQTRPVRYLEEQRRGDARQMAEIQAEIPTLLKKIEANLGKIRLIEQQMPQFGKYEVALEELRNEIRHDRERTDFQLAERERQMKKWTDLAQAQEDRLAEYKALMEKYAEHYQLNKRALASLQDFQESLQREQHQAEQLQRLAEERQTAAIEKWRAEFEQRWQKQLLEWKPQLTDLQRTLQTLQKQLDDVHKFNRTVAGQIEMILHIIEEDIQARSRAAADWQQRFEQLANGQD